MSNKILTFVFVILFVVLLGEIGYLFYTSQQKSALSKNQTSLNQDTKDSSLTLSPGENGEQAVVNNVLAYVSKFRLGILKTSVLKNHYEGKIIEMENKRNNKPPDNSLKLRFTSLDGSENTIFYNFDEINNKMSVFRTKQSEKAEKISVDDLKVDDSIWIDEELNLLDNDLNSFLISVKITIIE